MGLVSHSSGDRIIDLQRVIVMDSNHFNNRNNEMTEEKTELPHFVLENFLVDTQGLDEDDAWIRVLQNYDEIRKSYDEYISN